MEYSLDKNSPVDIRVTKNQLNMTVKPFTPRGVDYCHDACKLNQGGFDYNIGEFVIPGPAATRFLYETMQYAFWKQEPDMKPLVVEMTATHEHAL